MQWNPNLYIYPHKHICAYIYVCTCIYALKGLAVKYVWRTLYRFLSLGPTVHCESQEEQQQEWCTQPWSSSPAFLFFPFLLFSFLSFFFLFIVRGVCIWEMLHQKSYLTFLFIYILYLYLKYVGYVFFSCRFHVCHLWPLLCFILFAFYFN